MSGISWGFSGACAQYLFGAYGVNPLWVSSVRMLSAGIILSLFALFCFRGPFLQLWKNPHTLVRMVVFAIFGLAFCQITYLLAIQYSNAGTATIIQYVGPVLTVFFLCFLARRLPTKRELLALVCVVVGVFLLATHGNPAVMVLSPEALFWGLVSAFAYMLYSLLPRKLMFRYGSVPVVASALLIGGTVFSVLLQSWAHIPAMEPSGFIVFLWAWYSLELLWAFRCFSNQLMILGQLEQGSWQVSKQFRRLRLRYCGWEPHLSG